MHSNFFWTVIAITLEAHPGSDFKFCLGVEGSTELQAVSCTLSLLHRMYEANSGSVLGRRDQDDLLALLLR